MSNTNGGLTTNALLKSIKRRALVPDNQNTFSEQDFIDLMNEEMMIGLVPSILQMKEEYFIFKQIVPLVANKSNYAVPQRSLANKLREICYIDNVNPSIGTEYEMAQIAIDDRYSGLAGGSNTNDFTGYRRFYMQGSDVIVHPSVGPAPYGGLAFYFYIRPNMLVKENEVAVISNIDRNTGEITVSNLPTSYGLNNKYDFVRANSPHNILAIDITANSISSGSKKITVDPSAIPLDLQVGDYIPMAGQTCIPNVPTELHMVLAQRAAQRVLEALGDSEGLNNSTNKLNEMENKLSNMIENRVEGAPRKVVSRNIMMGLGKSRNRIR